MYELAIKKLTELASKGFIVGIGTPNPGRLCIESAICLAMGEPHGDTPSCVHLLDRKLAVDLNDFAWASPQIRAQMLLPIGIAQLGTADVDRTKFWQEVYTGLVSKVLPFALHAINLDQTKCESAVTYEEATKAVYDAMDDSRDVFYRDVLYDKGVLPQSKSNFEGSDAYALRAIYCAAKADQATRAANNARATLNARTTNIADIPYEECATDAVTSTSLAIEDDYSVMTIWRDVILNAYRNNPHA